MAYDIFRLTFIILHTLYVFAPTKNSSLQCLLDPSLRLLQLVSKGLNVLTLHILECCLQSWDCESPILLLQGLSYYLSCTPKQLLSQNDKQILPDPSPTSHLDVFSFSILSPACLPLMDISVAVVASSSEKKGISLSESK